MCINCGCHDHDHRPEHQLQARMPLLDDHSQHAAATACDTTRRIQIESDILAKNGLLAAANRAIFREKAVFVLNLVSSPGSGKTTILERTLRDMSSCLRSAVIEGDQQTDHDAQRIAATGVPVQQINTGAGCHLDAHMVSHAVHSFDLDAIDLLLIENVGNLVCPASFDLGEHHKVVVLSITEGEDKPLKYPHIFRASDVMLLNKTDLLPHLDFDIERCKQLALRVSPQMRIFELSSRNGQGMEAWYDWLKEGVKRARG